MKATGQYFKNEPNRPAHYLLTDTATGTTKYFYLVVGSHTARNDAKAEMVAYAKATYGTDVEFVSAPGQINVMTKEERQVEKGAIKPKHLRVSIPGVGFLQINEGTTLETAMAFLNLAIQSVTEKLGAAAPKVTISEATLAELKQLTEKQAPASGFINRSGSKL